MNRVKNSGQTLIEVIAALSIAVVSATAITTMVLYSLSNTNFSKSQSSAASYAQDGMELLHSLRDSNNASFQSQLNGGGSFCLPQGSNLLVPKGVSCTPDIIGNINYIREVTIDKTGCTTIPQVTVAVSWTDGKCNSGGYCHNVTVNSCLDLQSQGIIWPTP